MNPTLVPSSKGIAVITGASAGIGLTYADRLAGRGYDLLLMARRSEKLEELATTLRDRYAVNVEIHATDLTHDEDLARAADCVSRRPNVSLLVNNAGAATFTLADETPIGRAETMVKLNIIALAHLTHAVLPLFKMRGGGTIVNIGSILGLHWFPKSSVYSASKSFVQNFTRALQEELEDSKIVVQLVLPAATATDLWDAAGEPLSGLDTDAVMSVDDVVDAALAGLDLGEAVTLPSVEEAASLMSAYDSARTALFSASRTGTPAQRYRAGIHR